MNVKKVWIILTFVKESNHVHNFSTLSVGLNSTSVVLLEDFVKGCFNLKPSDRNATIFVKSIVIILGIVALSLVFLVEKLGGVLAVSKLYCTQLFFSSTCHLNETVFRVF